MVTALYASLLALLFVNLSMRTIRARRASGITIGDGGERALSRAMRVQANFAEYVPLTLILIMLSELQGLPVLLVHGLGLLLLVSRGIHAYGVSREPEDFRFRTLAMQMTFAAMILAASASIITAIIRQFGL